MALEQAQPWSEARKLRREQRAKIHIPIPSTQGSSAGSGGRLERMIRPYGRRPDHRQGDKENAKVGLLSRIAAVREKNGGRRKSDVAEKDEDGDMDMDHGVARVPELVQEAVVPKPSKAVRSPQRSPALTKPVESKVPEAKIPDAPRGIPAPSKPAPFAVKSASSSAPAKPSSLRERTTTSRKHEPSAGRKTAGRFAVDDDEDEDDGMLGQEELTAWASKNAVSVEIPLGWTFGNVAKVCWVWRVDVVFDLTEPVLLP